MLHVRLENGYSYVSAGTQNECVGGDYPKCFKKAL